MARETMLAQMTGGAGFIAALDQSGGSTPGALRAYGVPETAYSGEDEMFKLVHEMRVRIMSSPSFTGDKVIGAILFERTMDSDAGGEPVPTFLWGGRRIVPFLKVDNGLASEADGVALMKPMPALDALLKRAWRAACSAPRCARSSIRPRRVASRRSSTSNSLSATKLPRMA